MRDTPNTVLGALNLIRLMLAPGGLVRMAVPDFEGLSDLYVKRSHNLYPRLLGRIVGEQDYNENSHGCVFDRVFLEYCLKYAKFEDIELWNPENENLSRDGSFDKIDGRVTSLNLTAKKQR